MYRVASCIKLKSCMVSCTLSCSDKDGKLCTQISLATFTCMLIVIIIIVMYVTMGQVAQYHLDLGLTMPDIIILIAMIINCKYHILLVNSCSYYKFQVEISVCVHLNFLLSHTKLNPLLIRSISGNMYSSVHYTAEQPCRLTI